MPQVTIEQAIQTAVEHHQAGRLAAAEEVYRQVLAQCPDHPDALHLLGLLAYQSGQMDVAIDLIGRAVAINPAVAVYHHNLGEAYRQSGRWERAIANFQRSLELRPHDAETHNSLGLALDEAGRPDEAIAAYQRALRLKPDYVWAHTNLSNVLLGTGQLDKAIAGYHRALQLQPDFAEGHNGLGSALYEAGRIEEAIAAYRRAFQLKPDYATAYYNLGNALKRKGQPDEAIVAFQRALQLDPKLAYAHNSLGNVFKDQGRIDEALACYRKAVEIAPGFTMAASNLLYSVHFHPDYDALRILAEHRDWSRQYAQPLAAHIRPHRNDRSPVRKLKIGFVSPDFYNHPVGQSLLPLFTHRDSRQVVFFCYSDVRFSDKVNQQLRSLADRWHSIAGLGDARVSERIRDDRIDILVDLTLFTASNRMLVFARKPAPVQVTMLGLPSTTGLATMDYRLTDPYLDPPGVSDAYYTERSIRLPCSYWCYQPAEEAPPVGGLPARKNGFVTFGCLNQFAKVSQPVLQAWTKILRSVPDSRLVIHSALSSYLDAVRRLFEADGIAHDRVEFVARVSRLEYLRLYDDLDLCLDPFPYNGGITTLDSLWMGVPVITLAGNKAVSRAGVSILSNLDLPQLVALTPEEYVDMAVRWAGDPAALSELRKGLRRQMQASPLLDGKRYAADVQAAFRGCGRPGAPRHPVFRGVGEAELDLEISEDRCTD